MKVLSIISLVVCIISVLLSIGIANISCYNSYSDGSGYSSEVGMVPGMTSLIISLWFTAFSIVTTVVAFKKKKVTSADLPFWQKRKIKKWRPATACVGINETENGNLFSVFPNPAKNQINIKVDATLIGSSYTVFDNLGKKVLEGKIISENTIIELENLSAGVYLLSIGDNLKQTFKVIKE